MSGNIFGSGTPPRPAVSEAHQKMAQGLALHEQGRLADAKRLYRSVLKHNPRHFDALYFLATIAAQTGDFAEAASLLEKAIRIDPNNPFAHADRGVALFFRGLPEEAVACYDRALALAPDYREAYAKRGNALQQMGRLEDAVASYDRAIALAPDFVDAYADRGVTLKQLGRFDAAVRDYDRAIALQPGHVNAHWNRGVMRLLQGDFVSGWQDLEWRKLQPGYAGFRALPKPLWLGDADIAGKRILLHWEQGAGDTIQLSRYAPMVRALGAEVTLLVQDPLARLLKQLEPGVKVIGGTQLPDGFDYHCPLMSLPLAFRTSAETIPAAPSYLAADPALVTRWEPRLPARGRPRVGVVWRGGATHINDASRSLALAQMRTLFDVDVAWVSIQKEMRADDVPVAKTCEQVIWAGDDLTDFADTAAVIAQLDLVITVDTSVAHLAGAMGKPVWILLAAQPDWRWMLDREDTPWYPSARLFRQTTTGDWTPTLKHVASTLGTWAAGYIGTR